MAIMPTYRVSKLPVAVPPLEEQREIVAEVEQRLSVLAAAESEVEATLQRASRLRQSILMEAFAGRLVPQDPNDEPASVLLDRSRQERARTAVEADGHGRCRGRRTAKGGQK